MLMPIPLRLKVVVTIGLVSGLLSFVLVANSYRLRNNDLDAQQRRDAVTRYESDLASCLRGNDLRVKIRNLGTPTDQAIRQTLDLIFAQARDPHVVEQLRVEVDVPLSKIKEAVRSIELTDCSTKIPKPEGTS